jgi:hypothetical protein
MKKYLKLAAVLLPFLAGCSAMKAADAASSPAAPQMPVASVQAVTTEDPSGYATWIAKSNELFKAAGGPDHFTHVYRGVIAGQDTGTVFAVRFADSTAALTKSSEALMKVPERHEISDHLAAMRKLGPSILVAAVHFEGGYDNEWLFITDMQVKDEAAYVKALGELRAAYDSHGLKDIKINAFRVIAGRSDHSHEVVMSGPNEDRIAAALDSLTQPWMNDWLASVASLRTVVSNGVYQEISK